MHKHGVKIWTGWRKEKKKKARPKKKRIGKEIQNVALRQHFDVINFLKRPGSKAPSSAQQVSMNSRRR